LLPHGRHHAFTLVEGLLASVVLTVCVVAFSVAVRSGHMQSSQAVRAQKALEFGEELMETILSLPYSDPQGPSLPGPEAGETAPAAFDNMDDYDGYHDSGSQADRAGVAYPDVYRSYTRSVKAAYCTETVGGLGNPIPGLLVTVTVQDAKGMSWQLTRFVPAPAN